MIPATFLPGMVFTHPTTDYKIVVKEVVPFKSVKYRAVSKNIDLEYDYNYTEFYETLCDEGWIHHSKPLDQAFKDLDKKICSHRNIREDRFFSARVYRTCKDCGASLN